MGLKHPYPCALTDWILPAMDHFPLFQDSEITGSHTLSIAHQLQRGTGPGGCDALHQSDVLIRYGSSSTCLLQDYVVISEIPLFPGIVS